MSQTIQLLPFDQYTPSNLFAALTKVAATPLGPPSPLSIAFARGEVSLTLKKSSFNSASNSTAPCPFLAETSKGNDERTGLREELLEGITGLPNDPVLVSKLLQNDPLVADVCCIRSNFKFKVGLKGIHETHTSPLFRPTLQQMLWTILVFSHHSSRGSTKEMVNIPATAKANSDSNTVTPLILPVPLSSTEPIMTEETYLQTIDIIQFIMHTEALLHLYPLPTSLLTRLSEVARKVKDNCFARYMESRSPWGLNDRMGHWVFVLLEWWAATHPQYLKNYQSGIVVLKTPMPGRDIMQNGPKRGCMGRLKKELRGAMGIVQMDDSKERKVLSEGFEFIARMRREMMLAVWDEYEALAQEASEHGERFWKREEGALYLGMERYKLFRAMMGREVGPSTPTMRKQSPGLRKGDGEVRRRSRIPRKDLDRVRNLTNLTRVRLAAKVSCDNKGKMSRAIM